MSEQSVHPLQTINRLIWGYAASQAVYVMAKLGVADELAGGPKTAGALAQALNAHPDALRRLLRALTTVGLLEEDEAGRFAATELGRYFRSDHPQSMRDPAIIMGEPFRWKAWGGLCDSVLTGATAFEREYGETYFDYLQKRPEKKALFQASMTAQTNRLLPLILNAYYFSRFRRVVDVGGGQGLLLRSILDRYSHLTGVLYDLPAEDNAGDLPEAGLGSRLSVARGDMFQSVPPGGDLYMMKRILHDWSDEEAVQILRRCREAAGNGGRLLVMESVVLPPNQPDQAKWLDLNMLVLLTGRERTEDEFRQLFEAAGFRLARAIPAGEIVIMECATV